MAAIGVRMALFVAVVSMATVDVPGVRSASATDFSPIQPRVIGGNEVVNRCQPPYSWMVSLQFYTVTGPFSFCSAVMLTDRVLLTSGFCVAQFLVLEDNKIDAIIGERDTQMVDYTEQRIAVESYKIHPGFNATSLDNNIALIRLASSAVLSNCVQPAAKLEADVAACNDMDESCIIAGWGPFMETQRPAGSRLPRQASVTVFGDLVTSIWSRYQLGREQPKGSLYAEAKNPNIKACYFDWGGVVSCLRNGKYVHRGIIGEHNCNSDTPVPILVTDVPYFKSWTDPCLADWNRCPTK